MLTQKIHSVTDIIKYHFTRHQKYHVVEVRCDYFDPYFEMVEYCDVTFGLGGWTPITLNEDLKWSVLLKGNIAIFEFLYLEEATIFKLRWL